MSRATRVFALLGVLFPAALAAKAEESTKLRFGPWHQIGPFRRKGGDAFEHAFGPEKEVDLAGGCGQLRWKRRRDADGSIHDLSCPDGAAVYLYRVIKAGEAASITVRMGGDDGITAWLNGRKVLSGKESFRRLAGGGRARLELRKGVNHLLVKIWNLRGKCRYYFSRSDEAPKAAAKKRRPRPPRARKPAPPLPPVPEAPSLPAVRRAVEDMIATFGPRYAKGPEYLRRLADLEKAAAKDELAGLAREALLANPLLDFDKLLVLKRNFGDQARRVMSSALGTPKLNSHCNSSIPHPESGWDNELVILSDLRGAGRIELLYKPGGGRIMVDPDLHFDADRLMFSMISEHGNWGVFEIGVPGKGPRRLTPDHEDVEFYDSCYGPDGQIYFACNAAMQGLPCERGKRPVVQLYRMDLDTKKIRQITFEQDSDWCPTMMPDGRVLYLRWEYSDTPHYFSRILMTMNPDGTSQMEHYGSNSYWPNGVFNARPIPGEPTRVIGVVGGHHGISRSGRLVIFDTAKGRHESNGVVQEIPRSGHPVRPIIRDRLVDGVWPQFIYPYPLSAKYHLVSMKRAAGSLWGLYLVDVFDNATLIKEMEGSALLEAQPLRKRPRPRVIPDRVDLARKDALVYLVDVHAGRGLAGIPRGKVEKLRLLAYHFGYNFSANHDFVGIESSWDVKRVLGTVPVEKDGSAYFRVPANVPISIQPLDENGRALQLMRSWMVGMPGETVSCVGCHERQNDSPPVRQGIALSKPPAEIAPFFGPARGFSFRREVQPVLDEYCLACHGGDNKLLPDFSDGGGDGFSTAYRSLQLYVRRPGPEGDYHLTTPMEYHAGTSELIQMLEKGHKNVQLDEEAWQRLCAWIDLNAPYYGTWSEHAELREYHGADQRKRRREFAKLYAGLDADPEADADLPRPKPSPIVPKLLVPWPAREIKLPGWPFDAAEAARRQAAALRATSGQEAKAARKTIDLGKGVTMDLVLIPAGEFIMGDADGHLDERPRTKVGIDRPFWIGALEVTNAQFRLFDPAHESKYIDIAGKDQSSRGFPANLPEQPVIRVSWKEAMAFCRWLSRKTGKTVALPTEARWEYACRAGSDTAVSWGGLDGDFSRHANVADASAYASRGKGKRGGLTPFPAERRFNDRQPVVCKVGGYSPNAWGLRDMHGNAAEWTGSVYRPYPYSDSDGRNDPDAAGRRVVRGGSWRDRPQRCRSAFRLAYEPYQKVVNVGFRVVMECE